jgi:peptide/nickel transport system permease protein
MLGSMTVLVLALMALFAPLVAPIHPYTIDLANANQGPSSRHWLGTDQLGRDVWSRTVYGGRVSLSVGLVAMALSTVIGTALGAISGYSRGFIDSLVMRLTDIVLSFPTLVLIIVLVGILGPSIYNVMAVIGLLGWPTICRLVRGQFLSVREMDFVLAARCVGAPDRRIIFRHILPNCLAPVVVSATFIIAGAILLEAGLSFLGLGVQVPTPSWGSMLNAAKDITVMETMPWFWIPPGVMVAVCVLSINFIGDGPRDALDARLDIH